MSVCIYQKQRDRLGEDWEYSGQIWQLAHCVSILVQPVWVCGQVRRRGTGRVSPPAPIPRLRGFPHTSAPFYVSARPAGAYAGLLHTCCQKRSVVKHKSGSLPPGCYFPSVSSPVVSQIHSTRLALTRGKWYSNSGFYFTVQIWSCHKILLLWSIRSTLSLWFDSNANGLHSADM